MHYLHLTLLQAVSSIFCSPTSSHVSDLQLFSSVVICSTRFSPWKNRMYVSICYMLSVYHFQPNISLCPTPLQHYLLLWSLSSSFFSAHTLSFSVPFPFHFSFYSVSYFFFLTVTGKPFFIVSSLSHRWLFGWGGCRFYGWAGFFFGCGSLITMTVVSLDRYLKICHLRYGA